MFIYRQRFDEETFKAWNDEFMNLVSVTIYTTESWSHCSGNEKGLLKTDFNVLMNEVMKIEAALSNEVFLPIIHT